MGTIEAILIAATPSSPMLGVAEARLVAGRGIEGDRYFLGSGTFSPSPMKPDFEITLIEAEAVEAYAAESGHPFSPHDARRNLVTRGSD